MTWEYTDERLSEPTGVFVGRLMDKLNELGKQGWELVSILEHDSSFHTNKYATLILKRKIA